MDIQDILNLEPTLSFHFSQSLLLEIMYRRDWRCYSSRTHDDAERLANRYLKHHARMPGLVSPEVKAPGPLDVFFWVEEGDGSHHKGGLFSNGAVLVARPGTEEQVISLFIDEVQARMWMYPQDGFVILGEMINEEMKDEPPDET